MTLNTALTPTHRQKPTHKAQRVAVCGSAIVRCNQRASRIMQKSEANSRTFALKSEGSQSRFFQ